MKRATRFGLVAMLTVGLSISAFAGSEGKEPTPEQRKEFHEKRKAMFEERLSKLPSEEQKLARALDPLRDSLMRTIGEYHRKVKDGAQARSLSTERATIASLEAQIQKLQADNQEVWLDLLADLPGPGGPHGIRRPDGRFDGKGRPGKEGKRGPDCPKRGEMKECPRHYDGETPPPPPPID